MIKVYNEIAVKVKDFVLLSNQELDPNQVTVDVFEVSEIDKAIQMNIKGVEDKIEFRRYFKEQVKNLRNRLRKN